MVQTPPPHNLVARPSPEISYTHTQFISPFYFCGFFFPDRAQNSIAGFLLNPHFAPIGTFEDFNITLFNSNEFISMIPMNIQKISQGKYIYKFWQFFWKEVVFYNSNKWGESGDALLLRDKKYDVDDVKFHNYVKCPDSIIVQVFLCIIIPIFSYSVKFQYSIRQGISQHVHFFWYHSHLSALGNSKSSISI